jgi:hypothetical protein
MKEWIKTNSSFICGLTLLGLCLINITNINTVLYSEYPEFVGRDKPHRIKQLRAIGQVLEQLVGYNGSVGYMSDLDPINESSEFQKQRGWVQYAITPVRITSHDQPRYLIGNFFRTDTPVESINDNIKLYKRIDANVVIYSRE